MKKGFKKIMTLALVLALVFSFTIKPKQSEAVAAELTIAALVSSGMALPAALIAIAGAAAIGGLIGTNMDGIKQFGSDVWIDLTNKGVNPDELVDTTNKTVTMSPDLINSAAKVADTSTVNTQRISNNYQQIATTDKPFRNWQSYYTNIEPIAIATGMSVVFWTYTSHNISLSNNYLYLKDSTGANNQIAASYTDGHYSKYESGESFYGKTITAVSTFLYNGSTYYDATDTPSVYKAEIYTTSNTLPVENISSPSVFTEADNVYQRQLYANSLLAQNQVLQLDENMDYANSTLEDVLSSSNATYDETKTQTGILSNIWNTIKGIPSFIAAAATSAATAINTKAQELWDDAGAIWTGIADTATGIKADMNAKIGALSDAMAGGIDNIRTDVGALMDNLRAGIDTVASNVAAWGQLTLDGIDAGIGAITSGLTTVWEKVGAIPAAIDTAATDARETVTGLFVISEPQKLENQQNMSSARELFLSKFDWIKTPIEQLKSVYSQRKSLHDVSITILGQEVYILPQQFAGTVSMLRSVLSGSAILSTIIYIYRRVQPKEVV